jgi:hypothetical protein
MKAPYAIVAPPTHGLTIVVVPCYLHAVAQALMVQISP